MAKKVLLVGHCGPDSSYLRMTIKNADPQVQILSADDDNELSQTLRGGVDLVLFNRELGYGFDSPTGVEQIRLMKSAYPKIKTMLVSNYAEAQTSAVAAGALPGFGKRELGSAKVTQLLREALGADVASQAART